MKNYYYCSLSPKMHALLKFQNWCANPKTHAYRHKLRSEKGDIDGSLNWFQISTSTNLQSCTQKTMRQTDQSRVSSELVLSHNLANQTLCPLIYNFGQALLVLFSSGPRPFWIIRFYIVSHPQLHPGFKTDILCTDDLIT
jgi:hypothetical protein